MIAYDLTVNGLPYIFNTPEHFYPEEIKRQLTGQCPVLCDCDSCGGRAAGCEYDCEGSEQ